MSDYSALCRDLVALVDGVPYPIANLANAAALLQAHAPELAALLAERVPAWHASVAVRGEPGRRSHT